MANKHKTFEELNPPEEFYKIINDFISDIVTTFPEYSGLISKWWNRTNPDSNLDLEKELINLKIVSLKYTKQKLN